MNLRDWKFKTIIAGILTLAICISLLYPMEIYAAEDSDEDAGMYVETINDQAQENKENIIEESKENIVSEENPEAEQIVPDGQENEEIIPEKEKNTVSDAQKLDNINMSDQISKETSPEEQKTEGQEERSAEWNVIETEDLTLQYDDRYSFDAVRPGWKIASVKTIEILSNRVEAGQNTGERDKEVVLCDRENGADIEAAGVGKAKLLLVPAEKLELAQKILKDPENVSDVHETIDAVQVNVTVEPARLTLMYVAGQSNAEGYCSADSGYRRSDSIGCENGEVYSTYASAASRASSIAGISFSEPCTTDNASDFVAGSLGGDKSISGKLLEYKLNALTTEGNGKTGLDSGLAYEWNRLTGDKIWVVNTAWGGTSIDTWIPGGASYRKSMAVNSLVRKTYEAEIEAGHYTEGRSLMFWLQGEADRKKTAEAYYDSFEKLYHAFDQELYLDGVGIIMVRSNEGKQNSGEDISMSGPRIAQYAAGRSKKLSKVFVVSNANEQWISDDQVKSYFKNAYPEGYLTYPIRSKSTRLPDSVSKMHSDIHYSQIAHNENAITAADGMYNVLYNFGKVTPEICWKDRDGKKITSLSMGMGDTETIIPVTSPVYCGKLIDYRIEGTGISYDEKAGTVSAKKEGTYKITAYDPAGNKVTALSVTVKGIGIPRLTGTTTAKSGIKVSWNPVGAATGYAVYRKTSGGSWAMIATTTSESYTDTKSLKNGTVYYYTVRAYKGNINTAKNNKYNTKYWSGYDSAGVKGRYISVPVISGASASAGGTTISWKRANMAKGYAVYRKEAGGSWRMIGTTSSVNYTDKTALTAGRTYYYTVRAYTGSADAALDHKYDSSYWSHYDTSGVKAVFIAAPALTGVSTAKNGMKIGWDPVKGASGYAVYRKTSSTGWKMIDTTTSSSYTDKAGMKNGAVYYYTVRAYMGNVTTAKKNKYNARYWSGYDNSGVKGRYCTTPKLTGVKASASGTSVSWKKVSGATGYAVYRKASGGNWTTIATTTGLSHTDKTALSGGKTYYYTVRAYVGNQNMAQTHKYESNYWSHYDTTGLKSVYLDTPELTGTTTAKSGIKVSWKKVTGASGYAVYKKASSTGWGMIGTTTSTSYTDKEGMKNGAEYSYTVRAYVGNAATAKKNRYDARYWSGYDDSGVKGKYYSTPILTGERASASGRTITWNTISNVSGYAVYRKASDGNWVMIATTTLTSYTDKEKLEHGKIYYYTVRAYVGNVATAKDNRYDSCYWSYYDTTGIRTVYIGTPELDTIVKLDSGIRIIWNAVNGADGYAVYRKLPGEIWKMIDTTASTSYTDKPGATTVYCYTVRAYRGNEITAKVNKYSSVYWSGYEEMRITGE